MAKSLVPSEFKTHIIDQFLESVTEPANTVYYAFIGDHITEGSTIEEVTAPIETVRNMNTDIYRNMIIGKKMTEVDFRFMVNRHDWEANTVYTMYDDLDQNLFSKNFYVVVDEIAFKHVYKCLYNANGAVSSVKPLFQDVIYDEALYTTGDDYYETNDGYQWKYLYSIDSTTFSKFATQKYIPVLANTAIQVNAAVGAIDVIKIDDHGKNYNNYIKGQFTASDFNRITPTIATNISIIQSGTPLTEPANWYRISNGRQIVDFYKNCIIYLTSGVGAGDYRRILRSELVTGVGVVVQIEENFTVLPDDTTTYEISPEVEIVGDGSETVKAFARAIINANAANSIHKIEMLDVGENYVYASASVLVGSPDEVDGDPIDPTPAVIRPIIPPQGGHGANTVVELGARRLGMSAKFRRDESGLVSAENSFAQFGIIRDPLFSNTQFFYENTSGVFLEGEEIVQFKKIKLNGTFQANSTIGTGNFVKLVAGEEEFAAYFNAGDQLYVYDYENANHYIATVVAGSNTTAIALSETIPFIEGTTTYNLNVYIIKELATALISNINPPKPVGTPSNVGSFLTEKTIPKFVTEELIYGKDSRTIAAIVGIDINSRIGSYNADFTFADFNQLFKIQGTVTSGSFINDERVEQVNPDTGRTTSGYIHSWDSNNLYLTRVSGDFVTSAATITGVTSDAQFNPTPGDTLDITYGDLDPNSGSIIYVQNDIPVTREENQSEEVRVILEF